MNRNWLRGLIYTTIGAIGGNVAGLDASQPVTAKNVLINSLIGSIPAIIAFVARAPKDNPPAPKL